MNDAFLEPEDIQRITNRPPVPKRFDPRSNIDIDIRISTAESEANKASELSFMLQTMGQTLPFDLTKIILSEIAERKDMPDLAEKIMQYQPQPDPIEQQTKQLELQKLQAEIQEKASRAQENQVDMELKSAKAEVEKAKVRSTHAKADLDDQAFVQNADGTKHMQELEKENNKAKNDAILKTIESQKKQV
jgi:hypothetical protein